MDCKNRTKEKDDHFSLFLFSILHFGNDDWPHLAFSGVRVQMFACNFYTLRSDKQDKRTIHNLKSRFYGYRVDQQLIHKIRETKISAAVEREV
jgi:hypothetical protein